MTDRPLYMLVEKARNHAGLCVLLGMADQARHTITYEVVDDVKLAFWRVGGVQFTSDRLWQLELLKENRDG